MRLTHKLLLACAAAIAALALGATSASATTGIEVVEEGGAHCSVAEGNCNVHADGESELHTESGFRVSTCEDEMDAELNENGTGHINWVGVDHPPFDCTRVQCDGSHPSEHNPWEILNAEETHTNEGEMQVEFCLDAEDNPEAEGTNCTADILVSEPSLHVYEFETLPGGQHCEEGFVAVRVVGHWVTEHAGNDDEIEINHASL